MRYEGLNDCTVTWYRISIDEKTGKIKFETKIYQGYWFCGEEYMLGLNFELKSRKTADFMKIVLAVRYKKIRGRKRKQCFCRFQISEKTVPLIYNRKFFRLILKSRYASF